MNNVDFLKANNVDVNASLELWGDMESYNESLKEFKDSLNSKLASLDNYKNNSDWNNYSILAHSIKSEAKYLGFMKESEIFLAHELQGKANNGEFIINDFNNLRETILHIINILNQYFGESNNQKKNILIADDSNIILNFLEKSINNNYEILKASNGNDAISYLVNNDIYAILLDLNMPGSNGFDVLNYLESQNLFSKIPVVVITGDDTEETIKEAFAYPILDVLNKPFNEKNISRILDAIDTFYKQKN